MNLKFQKLAEQAGFRFFKSGVIVAADRSSSGDASECCPKLIELILTECDQAVSKLRGFSGVLVSGEVIDSDTWNLAIASARAEIQFLIEEIQHDQSNQ
jgi:hypothetical protein